MLEGLYSLSHPCNSENVGMGEKPLRAYPARDAQVQEVREGEWLSVSPWTPSCSKYVGSTEWLIVRKIIQCLHQKGTSQC